MTTDYVKVLAVIPAFNEEESLPATLAELRETRPDVDVLVVDDGSIDRTAEVARAAGVQVVSLPVNLGIGGAVQTGLHYADRNGYDVAFQYDADGQHRPGQIIVLIQPILDGRADMVLGSRFLRDTGYGVSKARGFTMWVLRTMSSLAIGQRVSDNTSGFRAYNRRAIRYMTLHCSCDYPEIEAIISLARSGHRFTEVSVVIGERVAGKSMFTPFRAFYFVVRSIMAVLISTLSVPKVRNANQTDGVLGHD